MIEHCGTPAVTGGHSDVWTFSTSLWNVLLKAGLSPFEKKIFYLLQ